VVFAGLGKAWLAWRCYWRYTLNGSDDQSHRGRLSTSDAPFAGGPEAFAVRGLTHDGFAEMWFDDLPGLRTALASPEWQALREDGRSLFAQPISVVVARERVIKAPR
jgi:EthD domain-containing protein